MTKVYKVLILLFFLFNLASADSTLRLVNVVYRHGDRSPILIYPTDPNQEDKWPQGFGWLSKIGIQQHYRLGQWLKDRYLDNTFMNSSYDRRQIMVRSSDEDRCLMSAYSNLAGLYPPAPSERFNPNITWQPIPVFTRPKLEDNMLNMGESCPRYDELFQQSLDSHAVLDEEKQNKDFYEFIGKKTTWDHENITNIWKVSDTTFCEKSHNLTLPLWLNDTVYNKLRELEAYQFTLMYNSREMSMLKGGPLVGEFIKNMKNTIFAHTPFAKEKMFMYSGHDTTVAAILSALGIYDKKSPQYTATVIAELHEKPKGKFYVNLFYKNVTDDPNAHLLTLPGCIQDCPIDDFIRLTKDAVPTDWLKQCETSTNTSSSMLATGWIVSIVLGSILVIVLVIIIVCVIRMKKNKDFSFRKFDM